MTNAPDFDQSVGSENDRRVVSENARRFPSQGWIDRRHDATRCAQIGTLDFRDASF